MRLQGDRTFIVAMCLMVAIFIAIKNAMSCFTMSRTTRFSESLGLFVSKETFSRYFAKDYYWHISPASGQILSRLGYRSQLVSMGTALLQFFGYAVCCFFMFTTLFIVEPNLTLVMAVVFAVVSAATYIGVRRSIDNAGQKLAEISAKETWAMNMATRGIREIIIYRKQEVFLGNIVKAIREGMPYKSFLAFAGMLPAWFLETSGFATIFGVMLYLIYIGRPIPEIVGSVSMMFLTAWRVLPSISRCMGLTVHIRGVRPMALSALELLEGFTATELDVVPDPDPHFKFEASLELKDVSFRYPQAKTDCLSDISITIARGESIALIGPSGAGKTTLATILSGLLEPTHGEMLIDGLAINAGGREALRQIVGFVPQNPLLLPGSVADNIALSQWGEKYDRNAVMKACRMAAIDFLADNPEGIDLWIGDGGQGLSGGQAQRVAIARALFTMPAILVFDEATSSLDQSSENSIAKTILDLKGMVTTIVITHRLSTVEKCDRIYWIDKGCIIASGSPETILPAYTAAQTPSNEYVA